MASTEPPSSPDVAMSEKTLQQEEPVVVAAQPSHPRDFAEWKWKGTVAVIFLTSCINGKTSDPASWQRSWGNRQGIY